MIMRCGKMFPLAFVFVFLMCSCAASKGAQQKTVKVDAGPVNIEPGSVLTVLSAGRLSEIIPADTGSSQPVLVLFLDSPDSGCFVALKDKPSGEAAAGKISEALPGIKPMVAKGKRGAFSEGIVSPKILLAPGPKSSGAVKAVLEALEGDYRIICVLDPVTAENELDGKVKGADADKLATLKYLKARYNAANDRKVIYMMKDDFAGSSYPGGVDESYTQEQQRLLLGIARNTIKAALEGAEPDNAAVPDEALKQKRGVFVTLDKFGQLRGCIGYVKPYYELREAVEKAAYSAAFEDPRFMAVSKDEFKNIEIEISILSPLKKISSVDEISVGKHGLVISKGFSSGLLLPQVATEYGWNREEFLEQTCRKAGLPGDAWKKGAEIQIFSAFVFNEKEIK